MCVRCVAYRRVWLSTCFRALYTAEEVKPCSCSLYQAARSDSRSRGHDVKRSAGRGTNDCRRRRRGKRFDQTAGGNDGAFRSLQGRCWCICYPHHLPTIQYTPALILHVLRCIDHKGIQRYIARYIIITSHFRDAREAQSYRLELPRTPRHDPPGGCIFPSVQSLLEASGGVSVMYVTPLFQRGTWW